MIMGLYMSRALQHANLVQFALSCVLAPPSDPRPIIFGFCISSRMTVLRISRLMTLGTYIECPSFFFLVYERVELLS